MRKDAKKFKRICVIAGSKTAVGQEYTTAKAPLISSKIK